MKHLRRNAGVDECGEKHVACDSGEAVEISNTHWDGLSGTVAVKLPVICRGPKRWPKREARRSSIRTDSPGCRE